jgi:hypothetical protein
MELRTTLQQAAALLQAGRIDDSARLCRQVLAAVPGQPDALHLLALAARKPTGCFARASPPRQ